MKRKSFFTILISFVILLGIFSVDARSVFAAEIIARKDAKVDETFIREDSNFVSPERIAIIPIKRPAGLLMDDEEWYRGIYYFYTARLGFPDVPFHYFVGSDGEIFEGNRGGDEQRILVEGEDSGTLIVGYLSKEDEDNFSLSAFTGLESIILELANRNAIKLEDVKVLGVETVVNLKDKTVLLRSKEIFGSWNTGLKDILASAKGKYKPVPKEYAFEIVEANSPAGTVYPGDSVIMTIKVKNNSKYNVYHGTDSELVGFKTDNKESKFFVNGVWASLTQPTLMEVGTILRPGETGSFSFRLNVPLFFGEQSETFMLSNLGGTQFPSNEFKVTLNVGAIDKKVVEIASTETGYLNVRDNPFASGKVFTKVNPGQRYIFLEDSGTGWVKIDLGSGSSGWVARQYVRFVN